MRRRKAGDKGAPDLLGSLFQETEKVCRAFRMPGNKKEFNRKVAGAVLKHFRDGASWS